MIINAHVHSTIMMLMMVVYMAVHANALLCSDVTGTLNAVNVYRKLHQVGNLKWDPVMEKGSSDYANMLAAGGCKLVHSKNAGLLGECLYMQSRGNNVTMDCKPGIDAWYSESKIYKYTKTPYTSNNFMSIGHFTQLVWKTGTRVGCGIARGLFMKRSPCKVIVCRFVPGGNTPTNAAFLANVLPPRP